MEILKQFSNVIKYKKGKSNVLVDTLSRRHTLFSKLGAQILGFDHIPKMYVEDSEFSSTYVECMKEPQGSFYMNEGYLLFKKGNICIPRISQRKLLVQETHEGGLMGHFGVEKTLSLLTEKFFWPHIRKVVQRHWNRCVSFLQSKSKTMPQGLYTLFPIASTP